MSLQPVAKTPEEQLERLFAQEKKLVRKINAAQRAGRKEKTRKSRQFYLRSLPAKARATADVAKKKGLKWDAGRILQEAETVNLWQRRISRPGVRKRLKPNGTMRLVQVFNTHELVRQRLIANLLNQCNQFSDHMYDIRGRGMSKLVADIKLIVDDGYKFALHLDISNFFDTLDMTAAHRQLQLPRAVVDNVLTNSFAGYSFRSGQTTTGRGHKRTSIRSTRFANTQDRSSIRTRGIPQGSAASPIVATLLLGDLGQYLPRGVKLLVYRDDIIVFARRRSEACSAQISLEEALLEHPAGPLELGTKNLRQISHGVSFVGRRFRTVRGRLSIKPCGKGARDFVPKLFDKVIDDVMAGEREPARSIDFVKAWMPQYRDCTRIEQINESYLERCRMSHLVAEGAISKGMSRAQTKRSLKVFWRDWDRLRYE